MASLTQNSNGKYTARKRLPDDVREEYGRLYGAYYEAKFTAPAGTKRYEAERLFHEWQAEVNTRIAAIRAQRTGEGIPLSRHQARALAGEWYNWFLARHSAGNGDWEQALNQVQDAMQTAVGEHRWQENNPNELWEQDEELRKAVRPVLADVGETSQFLATKAMVLNNEARDLFLDFFYTDLAAALKLLIRRSGGDYSPDKYHERFPKFEGANTGDTPTQLFERWVPERQPAPSTVESWRYVFRALTEHFKERSAASISPDEAQRWLKGLVTGERSARTVRSTHLRASKTVFGWAAQHKHIPHNPFKEAKITVPKQRRNRETQAFFPDEYRPILKAALEITDTSAPFEAAKRWVPWVLAYTGARPGEITQLRKQDILKREGVVAMHLTPEAGTIKSGSARSVPLHEHLVAQGFLEFVASHAGGTLFYKGAKKAPEGNPANGKKPPASQVRQRLAAWVRSLGVTDEELSPNHAWRHTFKQIADRAKISERMSDTITGHAHRTVGAAYGGATLEDMAKAMGRFPRYVLE